MCYTHLRFPVNKFEIFESVSIGLGRNRYFCAPILTRWGSSNCTRAILRRQGLPRRLNQPSQKPFHAATNFAPRSFSNRSPICVRKPFAIRSTSQPPPYCRPIARRSSFPKRSDPFGKVYSKGLPLATALRGAAIAPCPTEMLSTAPSRRACRPAE